MAPPEPQIAALDQLGEAFRASYDRPRPREGVRLAMATAVAMALVAAFMVATPPGQAVAEWIGDLVGVGDQPTIQPDREAVVIGAGEQGAFRYEVVATGHKGAPHGAVEPCMTVEFPAFGRAVAGSCLTASRQESLPATNISQPAVVGLFAELYPEAELMVQGLVTPQVEAVKLDYTDFEGNDRTVAARLSHLDGPLRRRIGVAGETKTYVAFLPPDLLAPPATENAPLTTSVAAEALDRISVTAFDADGTEVGRIDRFDRVAAQGLAVTQPEVRFAARGELAALCEDRLPQSASPAEVESCVFELIGFWP